VVEAGRARWKVENENNNTLKHHGYHLTHNFGHGRQHLSNLLVSLNLLAFLLHTVLALLDRKYQAIRAKLSSRKQFFQHDCIMRSSIMLSSTIYQGRSPEGKQACRCADLY
jgi:hypothetical protein